MVAFGGYGREILNTVPSHPKQAEQDLDELAKPAAEQKELSFSAASMHFAKHSAGEVGPWNMSVI